MLSTLESEAERFKKYTEAEFREVISDSDVTADNHSYLSAIDSHALMVYNPETDKHTLSGMRTISVHLIETDTYPTGFYSDPGRQYAIVLNTTASLLDYDLMSELHPMKDKTAYMWVEYPWDTLDAPYIIYGEWFRSDAYPDRFPPFDGQLGWADLPPEKDEEDE